MRLLLLIAAAVSAGLFARLAARAASRLPRSRPGPATALAEEGPLDVHPDRESPNEAERLPARGLGGLPVPGAATPDEQGSIPGLPDFTRGA